MVTTAHNAFAQSFTSGTGKDQTETGIGGGRANYLGGDRRERRLRQQYPMIAYPFRGEELSVAVSRGVFQCAQDTNFNSPNIMLPAGGFGQITSAADPRIGQLALNLLFFDPFDEDNK